MCFSHKFQQRSTSLTDARRDIGLTMEVLEAMKAHGGKSMQKAEACVMVGRFKGVTLDARMEKIKKLQFTQAVIDNHSTLIPDSDLTKLRKILDPLNWPNSHDALVLYGEKEIHDLAKDLGKPSRETVEVFFSWETLQCSKWEGLQKVHSRKPNMFGNSPELKIFNQESQMQDKKSP